MDAYLPIFLVALISVMAGLAMVIVFRYTSNQSAIASAKARIQANLLAVQLFQDQLPIVIRAYGRILLGAAHYLRIASVPLLVTAVPIALLIAQLDHYFGELPMQIGRPFLLKAKVANTAALDEITLQVPPEIQLATPAVHIPAENEIAWRLLPQAAGTFHLKLVVADHESDKQVVVSSGIRRVSGSRLRDHFWRRMLLSDEAALPSGGPIASIDVTYPSRTLSFIGIETNWIWLFFILSMIAGFIAKTALGIEI